MNGFVVYQDPTSRIERKEQVEKESRPTWPTAISSQCVTLPIKRVAPDCLTSQQKRWLGRVCAPYRSLIARAEGFRLRMAFPCSVIL
jgi:hypothetical protein